MKYLYGVKGCSHCGGNAECPKELKGSRANLIQMVRGEDGTGMKPHVMRDRDGREWLTFCGDFTRPLGGVKR